MDVLLLSWGEEGPAEQPHVAPVVNGHASQGSGTGATALVLPRVRAPLQAAAGHGRAHCQARQGCFHCTASPTLRVPPPLRVRLALTPVPLGPGVGYCAHKRHEHGMSELCPFRVRDDSWFTRTSGWSFPLSLGLSSMAHLNPDAVGSEVPAQGVACLQQGLPLQQLLPPGLPAGFSCGQGELPDLEPESDQLLHHAVQSGRAAVP